MTQSEAKKFCENEQQVVSHLIEIDSSEENHAIIAEIRRRNFRSKKIDFWLGITDRHSEGHWVLESTGKDVAFTNWHHNEPNNAYLGENCALIRLEIRGWNDIPCNSKLLNGWMRTALCHKVCEM